MTWGRRGSVRIPDAGGAGAGVVRLFLTRPDGQVLRLDKNGGRWRLTVYDGQSRTPGGSVRGSAIRFSRIGSAAPHAPARGDGGSADCP